MDFARKQLEKYGWTEGKGLGRNEDGISTAVKPQLKFDNAGIGHNIGEQFANNWWEKIFNSAADNIVIENQDENDIKMRIKSADAVEITCKSYSSKQLKKTKDLEYGSFIKTEKLTESGVESYKVDPYDNPMPSKPFQGLTDDEMFLACGGRTAHKCARHGLKLGGKLSRLEKQEKKLLKKMKKISLSDDTSATEKNLMKVKKHKLKSKERYRPIEEVRKSKKKRKSVSFNETVTKIYTVEPESSEAGSSKDDNSNEPILDNNSNGIDEGIEQDIENSNDTQQYKSFDIRDLSKAERKKLKKKRKLESKENTMTSRFLQKLNDDDSELMSSDDREQVNLKNRKYVDLQMGHPKVESMGISKSKRKRKKQLKKDKKELKSIIKSLRKSCRISESV